MAMDVLQKGAEGLGNAALMAYQVFWALAFGFLISAIVQAWIPRETIRRGLSGSGFGAIAKATGMGAASSSCSYAAVSIGRSLFAKGASAAAAFSFMFASTNLVWELGLVLTVLIGWQFALGEYVGGLLMIALMAAMIRLFISRDLEDEGRERAAATIGEESGGEGAGRLSWRERLTSIEAWTEVAENFKADWRMLYKEILAGFVLAGFIGLAGDDFFNALFITDAPPVLQTIQNVIVGPIIAVLSFVCSVGNVPLAAVLWSGGISFAGVMAFIFADLIVLPIVAIYRKYYGTRFALALVALMAVTMVIAALAVDLLFGAAGLIPDSRPTSEDVFGSVAVDYKLFLTVAGLALFSVLWWLPSRGARERGEPALSR